MKVSVLNFAKPSRQLGYLCAFLVAVTFSMPALAQFFNHGVDVGKVCPNATKVGDLATCFLGVVNTDDLGDDINVTEFFDVVDPGMGGFNLRNPLCTSGAPPCNLPISSITGNEPTTTICSELNQPSCEFIEGPITDDPQRTVVEINGVKAVTCNTAPPETPIEEAPLGLVFPCTMHGSGVPPVEGGSGFGLVVTSEYTVPVDSPDPLDDQGFVTVEDLCNISLIGCTFEPQTQTFGAAVSLFAPSIDVAKTAAAIAKVGDEITYTIGFTDTSTGNDFPGFENCTGNDPLLGGNLGAFTAGVTRNFTYTAQGGDPNPLLNTVTITCGVDGFDNIVANSDSHSVVLFGPSVELTKTCTPDPVLPDETIEWTITVNNTGNTDLNCLVDDPTAGFVDEPVTVVAGGSEVLNASRIVGLGDAPSISNTATVSCPIPGFDNEVTDSATAECAVGDDVGVPMLSDWARWLLVLMMLGAGLLLINRYSQRLR